MAQSGDNIINIGGAKINMNTSTSKGLEKAISIIAKFIINAQRGVNKIVYGDVKKKYKNKSNNKGDVNTALNNGLLSVVDEIASVDVCNIINYALNKIPQGKGFDPNKTPQTENPIERAKYNLQKIAYTTQLYIDEYYGAYVNPGSADSRIGLSNLVNQITLSLNSISSPVNQLNSSVGAISPELAKQFPDLNIINNFLQNALGTFNKYTDAREIPSQDVQKVLKFIDTVRASCIAIQGLNSVSSAINFLDTTLDVGIQEQIAKIQKLINLDKLIPLINAVLKTANNINSIARKVIGYVRTAQLVISIIFVIRKVLLAVDKFLLFLQIPSIFSTVGAVLGFTKIQQQTIQKFLDKLFERLGQINAVLTLIIIFVENLIIIINEIILKLRVILANIEACSNVAPSLIKDTKDTITNLTNTRDTLQAILNNYNNNKKQIDNRFGDYTIEIVTEEVVDEGIRLKRRYGIALGTNGYIVAQSTPTFASLDQIIINEVKVILVSKGLVKSSLQGLNPDQISTILTAAQFLDEGSLDSENLDITSDISGDIAIDLEQPETEELGLGKFVDNLSGGKALRKRMRKILAKQTQNLKKDISTADQGTGFSSRISTSEIKEDTK